MTNFFNSRRKCMGVFAGLPLLAGTLPTALAWLIEWEIFEPHPDAGRTPDALGVPSQQIMLQSDDRILRAAYVHASDTAPALMVFHGDGESLSDWAPIQALLHGEGISSYVFDYAGYGRSTGRPTVAHLRHDAYCAYAQFLKLTVRAGRRYVMGFSLGTGILLDAITTRPMFPPNGVILAAPFVSAREAAVSSGRVPQWIASLSADPWNNIARVSQLHLPILLVHSKNDEVVPFSHSVRLCNEIKSPHRLIAIENFPHDGPLQSENWRKFWPIVTAYINNGDIDGFHADYRQKWALRYAVADR